MGSNLDSDNNNSNQLPKNNIFKDLTALVSLVTFVIIRGIIFRNNRNHLRVNNSNSTKMISFLSNGMILILIVLFAIANRRVNQLKSRDLDIYPNYIWIYMLHILAPQSTCVMFVIIQYSQNYNLRKRLKWMRENVWILIENNFKDCASFL